MDINENKNNFWIFILVLSACFAISVGVRYQQFETWKKTPTNYFVGERPMMTTLDAPHWLRISREYNEGTFGRKGGLSEYPGRVDKFQEIFIPDKYRDPQNSFYNSYNTSLDSSKGSPEIKYNQVPLLSYIIAHIAPFFNYNYYLTGTLLIPVLASLFILPLGVYFFRIGIPLSGLMGGLIGTFSGGYFMRSSIGRIDTDMLNLFFPLIIALLILLASQAKSERSVFLYTICAGICSYLFKWWYEKPGFALVFFAILIITLFIQKISLRTILFSAFLFLLSSHPVTMTSGSGSISAFFKAYLTIEEVHEEQIVVEKTVANFPNTMTTISEVDTLQMEEVFMRVISSTTLGWMGIITLSGMIFFRWRSLLPLFPMIILGFLSFRSSNRFIMYLAPFIGVGLGYLINLGIESLFYYLQKFFFKSSGDKVKGKILKEVTSQLKFREIEWFGLIRQGTLYLAMFFFFWGISTKTAISYVPGPSINPRIYNTFLEVRKLVPQNSVIFTWWDYGYAITDATGLATFHDGGSQKSPKTYFIARSFISSDQEELYDITQFLATEGNRGIAENNTSKLSLLEAIRDPKFKPWDPIYIFFTGDMTGKFGAISKLGSWNLEKGGSQTRAFQYLACNKITKEEMNCRGAKIDLKSGFINNQLALRRLVFIRNGQVLREQKFERDHGLTLQLIVLGNKIVEVQLIDEVVFLSNYNQMFMLGRYRKDLFEEGYNVSPMSRLFRVKF